MTPPDIRFVAVLITAPSEEAAVEIARVLVGERLAACVNIVPGLRSIYRWGGKVEDEREVLMIAKTRESLFHPLQDRVKDIHPYSVPEIIALPILKGSLSYMKWLEDETGQG